NQFQLAGNLDQNFRALVLVAAAENFQQSHLIQLLELFEGGHGLVVQLGAALKAAAPRPLVVCHHLEFIERRQSLNVAQPRQLRHEQKWRGDIELMKNLEQTGIHIEDRRQLGLEGQGAVAPVDNDIDGFLELIHQHHRRLQLQQTADASELVEQVGQGILFDGLVKQKRGYFLHQGCHLNLQ